MHSHSNKGGLTTRLTRRYFVKGAGAAATVATAGLGSQVLADAPLPKVDESDPMARALNYVHDARMADTAQRLAGRFCHNCSLFAGAADDEWAACGVFPGKVVAGEGWCNVWAPKADQ